MLDLLAMSDTTFQPVILNYFKPDNCFFVAFNPKLCTGLLMEETHRGIARRRSETVAI
jgi:hypothetical protein